MNRRRANYLIILLALLAVVLVAGWAYWRLQPGEPDPAEISAMPTSLATAVIPTLPPTPTPAASPTPAPTDTPVIQMAEPTVTAVATPLFLTHIVQPGETLIAIAESYNLSSDEIARANNLADPNAIYPDQTLRIPTNQPSIEPTNQPNQPTTEPTTSPLPPAIAQPDWPPSLTGDEAAGNYPLTYALTDAGITIHYQPGTYPDQQMDALSQTVAEIWAGIQEQLGKPFTRPIDVYLAGTLFATNPALQGLAQSWQFRAFVLINGASHPGEERYIIGHELTHIAATHLLGPASSVMIHEGLAVHLSQSYLTEEAGYLPHTEFCAALLGTPEFKTAVQMHTFSYSPSGFGGHIRNFFHYNLSGCFVAYLLETYGLEKFDRVYDSGNYEGVYGRSLADLDEEWQMWLTAVPPTVDPQQLRATLLQVGEAYQTYAAASAGGVHANWDAYLHLNRARLAANQGQFTQAEAELAAFYDLFSLEFGPP